MPHLIFECNPTLSENANFEPLFKELHQYLAHKLPTNIENCKSRVITCNPVYIGEGAKDKLWAHLTLKILAGRTPQTKEEVGRGVYNILKHHFSKNDSHSLSLSVELIDLSDSYFK